MPILKFSCFILMFLCLQNSSSAQDKLAIKFGKVKPEDFNVTSSLIDSSTNAVIVADVGKSEFIANSNDLTFSLIFTEKKRIKIISKNGFDAATIIIRLYVSDDNKAEKLEQLDAYTYNLENGKVVETKIEKSSIFSEKQSKNWIYKKFTFPALREGSIIEYSCEIKSDFFINLQPWTFQSEYPVLWSQYEAGIPEFFKYVFLSQGYQPFFINKTDKSQTSFSFREHVEREGGVFSESTSGVHDFKVDGSIDYHKWVMKDVPALKEELFTTTLRNSIAKIEFQLNQVAYPNSLPVNHMDTWEKVASDLMEDEQFGGTISRPNNWLDDDIKEITRNASTQKQKAQKIYAYVRDNFTYNDNTGILVNTGLKDVFRNKNGSVADINMLLIAMLRNDRIDANPVILSTRDHGVTHEYYPLINRYNYVIAKVVIDDSVTYLDATASHLEFGKLPLRVYNGQAREITKDMALPINFIADSLKESNFTNAYISNMDKGGVEGSVTRKFGFYGSLRLRNKIAKTLPDEYKKSLQQEYPEEVLVDSLQIDSLKLLNEPVAITFDLKFKSFEDNDIVYFNPMMGEGTRKNPFAAAERFYPVEMPYTVEDTYTLMMEIPKGYKVDELPKSSRITLNGNDGMYEYLISNTGDYIQFRSRLVLNKATYVNEDYQFLRDFYAYIVKKEAEQIVFKKIK